MVSWKPGTGWISERNIVRIRLLGPLEVENSGQRLTLTAPRERSVLSLLLLEANRVVSIDRLVEVLWGEFPPATARVQIQICISAIRRSLTRIGAPGVVETRPPGYQFCVAPEVIDIHLLDALVREAGVALQDNRLSAAETALTSALDLWAGPLLADVDNEVVESHRVSLAGRRLALVEELYAIKLQRGATAEVIAALRILVTQNPLRESLHAQLMEALFLAGQRADALKVYRRAARLLKYELGIPPSRRLVTLMEQVLDDGRAAESRYARGVHLGQHLPPVTRAGDRLDRLITHQ